MGIPAGIPLPAGRWMRYDVLMSLEEVDQTQGSKRSSFIYSATCSQSSGTLVLQSKVYLQPRTLNSTPVEGFNGLHELCQLSLLVGLMG